MLSTHGLFSERNVEISDNPKVINVVQDTDPNVTQLRNWRHLGSIREAWQGNTGGLDTLYASASAAPGANHFNWIANQIRELSHGLASRMIILDLREESHAYLNDLAITHATEHNWINRGKTEEQSL